LSENLNLTALQAVLCIRGRRPMRAFLSLALLLISGLTAFVVPGQKRQSPAFEVASVKPSRIADTSWSVGCAHPQSDPNIPKGRCQAKNASVFRIIAEAYGLPFLITDQYLLQAPGWARTERYDVDAKAENSSATNQELLVMLQNLLAERFKLQLH